MTAAVLRLRNAPVLRREAFRFDRLGEFTGTKELVAQIGHEPESWPLAVAKELIDNGLDESEEAGIPPQIAVEVSTERGEIIVTDNGRGLPADTLDSVVDFAVRISSREAYVSPTRGRQGLGLKGVVAMPYALDGNRGVTVVESRGTAHRIVFEIDRVRRTPRILRESRSSDVRNGTRITLYWPPKACALLEDARSQFVQITRAYAVFNPHLTLCARWDDKEFLSVRATNPNWPKWLPSAPTSAHWYGAAEFEHYIAALIASDQDHGRTGRRVQFPCRS